MSTGFCPTLGLGTLDMAICGILFAFVLFVNVYPTSWFYIMSRGLVDLLL